MKPLYTDFIAIEISKHGDIVLDFQALNLEKEFDSLCVVGMSRESALSFVKRMERLLNKPAQPPAPPTKGDEPYISPERFPDGLPFNIDEEAKDAN